MARSRSAIATVAAARTRCAPSAADAVAHGAQAQRRVGLPGAVHAGHAAPDTAITAIICAATLERTPQTALPVLRRGDGDRAPAHRARGNAGWRGRAPRCSMRGTDELSQATRESPPASHMPKGMVALLGPTLATCIKPPLHERVEAATKTASASHCGLPGGQCRPNFQKMFSVPATGT